MCLLGGVLGFPGFGLTGVWGFDLAALDGGALSVFLLWREGYSSEGTSFIAFRIRERCFAIVL